MIKQTNKLICISVFITFNNKTKHLSRYNLNDKNKIKHDTIAGGT